MNAQPPAGFCPYKGLQPYTEADRAYFFGRERDQEIIAANLYASPLTVLYGASGSGKSSVLLAGVVPQLRQTRRLAIVVFRDWQNPDFQSALKSALRQEVERSLGKPCDVEAALPFDDFLAACARRLRGPVFFLLDQFEEYFLYHPAADAEDSFDAAFARAVNREEIGASFLLSIREDGISKLDRFQGRIPNLLSNLLRLDYLDRAAATRAIRRPLDEFNRRLPAGKTPVTIEDELVEALLRDLQTGRVTLSQAGQGQADVGMAGAPADARIETPFLQLVLTRLWQEEMAAGSRVLRLATLKTLGGTENIARTHLDTAMEELSESERDVAARMFRFLVTPSGSKIAQDLPSLVAWSEVDEATARSVLVRLTSGTRILRPVTAAGQADRYEIFHDVLAPAILDWRRRYVQVQELREAERQAEEQGQRAEAQARAAARLRWLAGALAVVTLLVLAMAVFAFQARKTANAQREAALLARDEADQATEEAHEQAVLAEEQSRIADAQAKEAEKAKGEANAAKDVAEEQRANAEKQGRLAQSRELAAAAERMRDELGVLLALEAVKATYAVDGTVTREAQDVLAKAARGAEVRLNLPGHQEKILALAYSPDGSRLASQSRDGALKVWDAVSGQLVKTLPGESVSRTSGIAFSADGRRIAAGEPAGVRVYDLASGEERLRASNPLEIPFRRFVLSPDGERVATVGSDETVKLWRSPGGTEPAVFSDEPGVHETYRADIAFSADGARLIIVRRPILVKVVDAASGAVLQTRPFRVPRDGPMALSPDGRLLATREGLVEIWEVETNRRLRAFQDGPDTTVLAFSADGSRIVTAGNEQAAVWNVGLGTEALWKGSASALALSPKGDRLVLSKGDGSFRVLDVAKDSSVFISWGVSELKMRGVAFSLDGRRVAATSDKGMLRLWEVASGREEIAIPFGEESLVFSPDGRRVAAVQNRDNTVALYDSSSGKQLQRLVGVHTSNLSRAAFSPDGSRLATVGSDHTGGFWDLASGKELFRLSGRQGSFGLAFSPDGRRLATTGLKSTVWDVASRKPTSILNDLPGNEVLNELPHNEVVFSLHGHRLAVAAGDTTTVLDAVSGRRLYPDVKGGVRQEFWAQGAGGVAFSPDGRLLATVREEESWIVKIWDAHTGAEQATLYGHEKAVRGIAFSADSTRLIAVTEDWTLHVHPLRIADLMALARSRVDRELTVEERKKYLHQP